QRVGRVGKQAACTLLPPDRRGETPPRSGNETLEPDDGSDCRNSRGYGGGVMKGWAQFRSWAGALLGRARMEREMDEEMRFHIEARAADLMGQGVRAQEAARQAKLEFGRMETAKHQCRDAVGVSFVETFMQDVRQGARVMARTPMFTITAVVVLAL